MRGVSRLALLQAAVLGAGALLIWDRRTPPRRAIPPVRKAVPATPGVDAGDRFHPGADLSKARLAGADLRGRRLSEVFLFEADLSGADLRGCAMVGIDLTGADLSRA